MENRFEFDKEIQKSLLQQIESILIPSKVENNGGDILMICNKDLESEFTIEVCLEYAEFFYFKGYKFFDRRDDYYIENVLSLLMNLINQNK